MEYKHWKTSTDKKNSFTIITSSYIGKIEESKNNNGKTESDLRMGKLPEHLYKIPFSYIRKIEIQEGKHEMTIFFGQDSKEIYKIEDSVTRQKIFNYLKNHDRNPSYELDEYSFIRSGKKPIIAILILTLLFGWAFLLATELEKGLGGGPQLVIVLAVAGLGTKKLGLFYTAAISIAILSLVQKTRTLPVIHILNYT